MPPFMRMHISDLIFTRLSPYSMSLSASSSSCEAQPNRCKKLPTRRLLARQPSGRLSQSALRGGALSAKPFSSRRTKRAAVSVACEAALQLMRQSLAGPATTTEQNASAALPAPETDEYWKR